MSFLQEFQVVVLAAGKGSRISEITTGKPKCLLPIGPKPLVWYPLYKLQKSGFAGKLDQLICTKYIFLIVFIF